MIHVYLFIAVLGLSFNASKAECTSRGRFPNNDETDCRGYTMCLPGPAGYIQYKLACPQGSVYSHTEQQCTKAATYQCYPDYFCFAPGDYKHGCNAYVSCIQGLDGIVTARKVDCSSNQVYSPMNGCVESTFYKCLEDTTDTTTVKTVTEVTVQVPNVPRDQPAKEVPGNHAGTQHNYVSFVLLLCFVIKFI